MGGGLKKVSWRVKNPFILTIQRNRNRCEPPSLPPLRAQKRVAPKIGFCRLGEGTLIEWVLSTSNGGTYYRIYFEVEVLIP